MFWNLNFLVIYGFINKIIASVGSKKLINITQSVCDKINTPAAEIVRHGILMWYNKNLQVSEIHKTIDKNDFSETAKKTMRFLMVNHCALHNVDYRDRQRINDLFHIPTQKLLSNKQK